MQRRRESRMSRRRSSAKGDGSEGSGSDGEAGGPGYDLVSDDDRSGSDMFRG